MSPSGTRGPSISWRATGISLTSKDWRNWQQLYTYSLKNGLMPSPVPPFRPQAHWLVLQAFKTGVPFPPSLPLSHVTVLPGNAPPQYGSKSLARHSPCFHKSSSPNSLPLLSPKLQSLDSEVLTQTPAFESPYIFMATRAHLSMNLSPPVRWPGLVLQAHILFCS